MNCVNCDKILRLDAVDEGDTQVHVACPDCGFVQVLDTDQEEFDRRERILLERWDAAPGPVVSVRVSALQALLVASVLERVEPNLADGIDRLVRNARAKITNQVSQQISQGSWEQIVRDFQRIDAVDDEPRESDNEVGEFPPAKGAETIH